MATPSTPGAVPKFEHLDDLISEVIRIKTLVSERGKSTREQFNKIDDKLNSVSAEVHQITVKLATMDAHRAGIHAVLVPQRRWVGHTLSLLVVGAVTGMIEWLFHRR